MEAWEVKDLKEIAKIGFAKLDIEIEDDIAEKIAIESLTSPQLMQYICLNICTILELSESRERRAYYQQNEYSDKDTKDRMRETVKRVLK